MHVEISFFNIKLEMTTTTMSGDGLFDGLLIGLFD